MLNVCLRDGVKFVLLFDFMVAKLQNLCHLNIELISLVVEIINAYVVQS